MIYIEKERKYALNYTEIAPTRKHTTGDKVQSKLISEQPTEPQPQERKFRTRRKLPIPYVPGQVHHNSLGGQFERGQVHENNWVGKRHDTRTAGGQLQGWRAGSGVRKGQQYGGGNDIRTKIRGI